MAGIFIQATDFKGYYSLPTDQNTQLLLEDFIEQFEKDLIVELLGGTMAEAFIRDYQDANPTANVFTEARYEDIFKAFAVDHWFTTLVSKGLKEMLLGFLWFYFTRDNVVKQNLGGIYKNTQENGELALFAESKIYQVENKAIRTHNAIQRYISVNPDDYDYDTYKGQERKNYNSFV